MSELYKVISNSTYSHHEMRDNYGNKIDPEVFCNNKIDKVLSTNKGNILFDGKLIQIEAFHKTNIERDFWWDKSNMVWKITVKFDIPMRCINEGKLIEHNA